jgi:hypothetical protein
MLATSHDPVAAKGRPYLVLQLWHVTSKPEIEGLRCCPEGLSTGESGTDCVVPRALP